MALALRNVPRQSIYSTSFSQYIAGKLSFYILQMLRFFRTFLLICWSVALWPAAPAVAQGSLDPTFTPTVLKRAFRTGDYPVRAMLQQPDGKILVGGNYDFIDNQLASRLRRLNADGSPDAAFATQTGMGPDPAGIVGALALQSTGKILAGCIFTTYYNQLPKGNLVRLLPTGALDASFNLGGSGFSYDPSVANSGNISNSIRCLAVQPDDKILVGGYIGSYNGLPVPNLVRLNADGTLDTSFNVGSQGFATTNGTSSPPNSGFPEVMVVQPDGKIVVGGNFGAVNGTPAYSLVRLNANGSIDNTFLSTGTNGTVRGLARQPDGKLLVGGLFSQLNGQPSGSLARLNADGTLDASFAPGTIPAGAGIYKVRLRADGTVIASGTFSSYNGVARGSIAKVSSTGVLDTSFGPASGTDNLVYEVLELTNGQTLAGGTFTTFGGVARTGLARLNGTATTVDAAYNPVAEFRGTIFQLTVLANGELCIEGDYDNLNGTPVASSSATLLHVLSSNGAYNRTLTLNNPAAFYHNVQPDGRVYVAELTAPTVARLTRHLASGALDASFAAVTLQVPANSFALHTKPLGGGDILWIGNFTAVNGQARSNIARLSASGVLDAAFNPPVAPWLGSIPQVQGVQPNGQPLVFWIDANGSYLLRLSATTGAIDPTLPIGSGNLDLALPFMQPNGQVVVSGVSSFNGQAIANNVVRLTTTGQVDPSFAAALPFVVFTVQPDGRFLGTSADMPLQPAQYFRRLNSNGSLDTSFPAVSIAMGAYFGSAAYPPVIQPQDGKILLYGGFTSINGQPRIGLARLTNTLLAARPALAGAPLLDVFPNPTQQQITLQLPVAAVSATAQPVTLLDMQGRTIRRFTLPARQAQATFPLADVAAGIYLLETSTSQGPARQRVAITH